MFILSNHKFLITTINDKKAEIIKKQEQQIKKIYKNMKIY